MRKVLNKFKFYCVVWNKKCSKWLLLLPVVFSVLMEASGHAAEEHPSEPPEFQYQESTTLPQAAGYANRFARQATTDIASQSASPRGAGNAPLLDSNVTFDENDDGMGQVTSVSQLSDVQPTD